MSILVSGLVNIETTLHIESFPLEYDPVRYPFWGINTTVSGVGVNVSLALHTLGRDVYFCTLLGNDFFGEMAHDWIQQQGLATEFFVQQLPQTAQSVILYDKIGRRQIHVDLKNIQEQRYPLELFESALERVSAAVLCNINFNRNLLEVAKRKGISIFTDVHTIADPDDEYNRDFMAAADVLFLSDEKLWTTPEKAAQDLMARYGNKMIVIGQGERGALLLEQHSRPVQLPAIKTRPIVSTIGAGDALFASFINFYIDGFSPLESLKRAMVFASWKIGTAGASQGFLNSYELEKLYTQDMPSAI
ncbi:carbohydrate kinase family protein [Gracilinema caldarium]|uniref:PfkB domain protein n=1 Tax=Gracilinema caldarium (strain ATCC 51460 / DSM 7334 / H1) TaxID=744872 RepID=F8EY81_GRAC1|nr:carbohydrate kinase family protein [Gracilinema caldarium]AEJ18240.1 PfkB domain protein [Gracilinema caldarium DSM 7334]